MYNAFDVGAFQYLVKPVDEQKFAEVFGRAAGRWVRYGVFAFAIMGYAGIRYKKQIGKAVFVMLAFIISIALAISYSVLLVIMTLILYRLMKDVTIIVWQDVILLSILNLVGSMITKIIVGLLIVKIDDELFILFDEKPDLLWKIPLVAVLIFAGEFVLIYFWQRYCILLAERQKHFVEEQQVKAMKMRLEEAENFYGSICKVRHEMKNRIANIKAEKAVFDTVCRK